MKHIIFLFLPFVILSCSNAQVEVPTQKSEKLNSQDTHRSKELSIAVKTKFDSEVGIQYVVYYHGQHNFSNNKDSINQNISKVIINYLGQFEMYEMWATKRDSLEIIIGKIIKNNYPKTERTILLDVVIPEEAEHQFLKTDESRQEILDTLDEIHKNVKLLTQKLESDKGLSETETTAIKKEIEILEIKWKSVQNEGKLLTRDYKL